MNGMSDAGYDCLHQAGLWINCYLYGTLIDIHTDEYCDETWKKWIAFLDDKGIKHPELNIFRDDFFNKDKEYRLRPSVSEHPEIAILKV